MVETLVYYIGRALQVLGMATAAVSLFVYMGDEKGMGPMMKFAGLGLVEFYIGYGLTMMVGKK